MTRKKRISRRRDTGLELRQLRSAVQITRKGGSTNVERLTGRDNGPKFSPNCTTALSMRLNRRIMARLTDSAWEPKRIGLVPDIDPSAGSASFSYNR